MSKQAGITYDGRDSPGYLNARKSIEAGLQLSGERATIRNRSLQESYRSTVSLGLFASRSLRKHDMES